MIPTYNAVYNKKLLTNFNSKVPILRKTVSISYTKFVNTNIQFKGQEIITIDSNQSKIAHVQKYLTNRKLMIQRVIQIPLLVVLNHFQA